MVFYDKTGLRRQYVWILIGVTLIMGVAVFFLTYTALTQSSTGKQISYISENDNDPRFSKTIALTFDDGPDPKYTEELITLLKAEGVPASFFVIGEHVLQYPEITQKIVSEGFELGNHTFTHSEHMADSEERLRYELITTEQAIRSVTGRETKLFRPPFLEDVDVGEFDGGKVASTEVQWAESAGYIVVGANLDTRDWNVRAGASNVILSRLTSRVHDDRPNVIIMHEHAAEGATIEALRTFIPLMKARGYRFVYVSEYFGLTPTEVMPPATQSTVMDSVLVGAAKTYVHGLSGFTLLVMLVSVVGIARMWAIVALRKTYVPLLARRGRNMVERLPVSILIPAYNEEANIEATIRSVARNIKLRDEIIVVDDGSTDSTASIVKRLQKSIGKQLTLLQKENGGTKGAALQFAMPYTSYEHVICIDADTIVGKDAIEYLVSHFKDKKVGAVAGKIYPAHVRSLLSTFQYLEYMQGQNLDKDVFALGNAVAIVPGALGAWRKSAIKKVGGYSPETVVEDQDLTLALIAKGYRVAFEPQAKAYTEVPDTFYSFFKQRSRWIYGTMQCVWKYRYWTFSFRRPSLGWLVLPNTMLFNLFVPLLVPVIDGAIIASVIGWVDLWIIIGPFIIFTLFDIWCAAEGVAYEQGSYWRFIPLVFWQRLFYRYVMAAAIARAIWTAVVGGIVRWGAHNRRGDCHNALARMVETASTPTAIMPMSTATRAS